MSLSIATLKQLGPNWDRLGWLMPNECFVMVVF